jgi:hypothetical protein
MKSPFPGMDPYLERHWRDVHHRLVTYTADCLRPLLPDRLRPRIEERVFIDNIDYRQPPLPSLDPDAAAWADDWLRAKGVR